ncbi:helix-turn-helix transcriptional regulator [Stenotrophomonas rhizophila]|uniref:helix-turn-helix transcriptional regulator n=1 Tax=Stenotrophomonas rhizophila TaxID=216778 RepID=UPI00112F6F80|nr:AraC family transcriptional regulator [Stenotrophomonas rhizophila]
MTQSPALLRRLLRAKDRMDQAPHEAWPVRRLAAVSATSEAYFARQFRLAFGLPPHRYLLSRRIERAVALCRDTDLPVTEIAYQTGWSSLGTFGRVFRDITGQCPGDLRGTAPAQASPGSTPECILRAARRPDLTTSVSEKRQCEGAGTTEPQPTEVP